MLKSNVFGEVIQKRLDSEGLGGLGDILGIFGEHFGSFLAFLVGSGGSFLAPWGASSDIGLIHLTYNFESQSCWFGNLMNFSGSAGCVNAEVCRGVLLVKGPFFVKKGPFSNICPSSENP